ncbi:peptidoglycan-binding protein [Kitasatospora sp. NPDC048545]|uniref:peptidoglycan-binding protein n=1 Tax=Kitasatospora sp. NPDC048545 TaxID=3157208 RepID=UPI0033F46642
MAKESTTQRCKALGDRLKDAREADSKNDLIDAIKGALAVHAPLGSPSAIEAAGNRFKKAAADSGHLHQDVVKITDSGLPDVWTGNTGAKAAEVVGAAGRALDRQTTALHNGGIALHSLADALSAAQSQDSTARSELQQVLSSLGGREGLLDEWFEDDDDEAKRKKAQQAAIPHVESMLDAAKKADEAARAAARDLNKLASEARAGKLPVVNGVTSADKLMLAETSGPDGPTELNELLTANDMNRSGEYLNKMNDKDRADFEKLLAASGSPQERAYLMKALAAGHSLDEIRTFQNKIHGKTPEWLRTHLTPVYTRSEDKSSGGVNDDGSNRNTDTVNFGTGVWRQKIGENAGENTCVASSTVTARAMVDPLYALDLTGGPSGQENDPAAFQKRLLDEEHRVHAEGHGNEKGMEANGKGQVLEKEVSPHTGADFDYKKLPDDNARREILPDIEKAVADGKPVPIGIEGHDKDGKREGHALLIVGQEGNMLQVYNPWGFTTWVSEDDFINGHMDRAADNRVPTAYAVHLPR